MIELNKNHWYALFFGITGWLFGWYSLILIGVKYENNKFPVSPTKYQWYGALFAILIGIISWFRYLFTLQGDKDQQGDK